jgi:hypothetical protein
MHTKMRCAHSEPLLEITVKKGTHHKMCALQACKMEFVPKRAWQTFCSKACKDRYWRELRKMVTEEIKSQNRM